MSRVVQGVCPHDCPDSCGWTVTVDDTPDGPRAVAVRGNPDHPYSAGELCPKVNRYLDRVYSPDRVLHPLKRVGPKGAGRFEPISWDDALDEIASRLHALIDAHGGEAILPFSSAGNQSTLALAGISARFFHRLGASRLSHTICGATVGAGIEMTNGSRLSGDPLDLEHSRLIIVWATNTRLTNRHLWPTIERARSRGARLIVIDPIRTLTADAIDPERGDLFIQPRPGTDTALILAMIQVIIAEGLWDRDWVRDHTTGFEELCDAVADWTPQRASAECGVDAATITRLARDYATTSPAAIRTLIGGEHHENGAMFARTLACLPALTGAWKRRGGGLFFSVGTWHGRLVDGEALERGDLGPTPEPRIFNMGRLGEALLDADPPIRALIVWNANPAVIVPDANRVRDGLGRDDLFTVVHDQFLTDTARYADIVLPATTQIEATDVVTPWGHLWLGWNEAAIPPRGEAVSNPTLFRRLSRAMGLTDPCLFDDDDTLLAAAFPTVDLAALRQTGWVKVPTDSSDAPWRDGEVPTPSGMIEFASTALDAIGQPRIPTYVRPVEGPFGPDADRFPLQLMTPKQHLRFLNSSYAQLPSHGGASGGPVIELDPADAATYGLSNGDRARVYNRRASLELTVAITDRLRPGLAAIPWGWWRDHHPDGQVANSLTNATLTDWGGGVAYSDTLVAVEPAKV
ncbi:MAG: molybdopterin oxidoreductase [Ilumatobacter coccineus]|uniref:Molybdopterin oxidoreductase n=1 Tax=Ilumatobacter coccineus TaxID=467094 RepID=A0A2G6KD45_9ACTN|nr:MAG: molybdopterin oxidoreductase [Ilumatobacter coccineus]